MAVHPINNPLPVKATTFAPITCFTCPTPIPTHVATQVMSLGSKPSPLLRAPLCRPPLQQVESRSKNLAR